LASEENIGANVEYEKHAAKNDESGVEARRRHTQKEDIEPGSKKRITKPTDRKKYTSMKSGIKATAAKKCANEKIKKDLSCVMMNESSEEEGATDGYESCERIIEVRRRKEKERSPGLGIIGESSKGNMESIRKGVFASADKRGSYERDCGEEKKEVENITDNECAEGQRSTILEMFERELNKIREKFYYHNPLDVVDLSDFGHPVYVKGMLRILLQALGTITTPEARELSVAQRKCRFPEENILKISPVYTFNLCKAQCRMRLAQKKCGCIPYFYRRVEMNAFETITNFVICVIVSGNAKVCDVEGMHCLGKHPELYVKFLYSSTGRRHKCKCISMCNDVTYNIDSKEVQPNPTKEGTSAQWGIEHYPKMRVKRDVIFGFTDLWVSVGGTGGLFLGCSVLSIIEIFYFLTLRLYVYLYRTHADKKRAQYPLGRQNDFPRRVQIDVCNGGEKELSTLIPFSSDLVASWVMPYRCLEVQTCLRDTGVGHSAKALACRYGAALGHGAEVTGEWRKLHNTELHALYSSPDIIRNIKSRRLSWAGHVAHMGESRNAYRVLVGRPEGKRPLGRPRRRWEDNIKMDLREVGYDYRDWINLAQDRDQWRAYVRAAMNLRVP
ncbi:hypothetical protein ANN_06097, partial [Periplaneta americana]